MEVEEDWFDRSISFLPFCIPLQSEADAAIRTRRQRRLQQKSAVDKIASDKRTAEFRATYEAYIKEREQMDPGAARRFAAAFKVRSFSFQSYWFPSEKPSSSIAKLEQFQ